jgi:4-amino-4-deoxy-L-arabinose transferase-like glycosyltransferase
VWVDEPGMRRAERAVLVGIVVAVAIALRWGFVAMAHVPNPLRVDAGEYAQCASNLVQHGIYSTSTELPPLPDSFRSPGYPLFLAMCRVVGGAQHWMSVALALQVALGGLTVLLCYRLARAFLGFLPSLGAALLCALSPHLVVSGGYILTECWTTFALTAGLWLVSLAASRGIGHAVLAGLVLGFGVLCNETLVFVPFVVVFALWQTLGRARAITLLVGAMLPFAMWTVRNQSQTLARTSSERMTASISHGSYPGMVFQDPRLVGFPYREDPEQPAFGSSWQNLRTVLGTRIAADPWRYASWYLLEKPLWLWRWNLVQGNGVLVYDVSNNPYDSQVVVAATGWLMRWLHVPVMVLAALGAVWFGLHRRTAALPRALALLAIFGTLAYLPVIPDPRYLQPFRPLLFVLCPTVLAVLAGFVLQRMRGSNRDANSSSENGGQIFQLGLPVGSRTAPPSS